MTPVRPADATDDGDVARLADLMTQMWAEVLGEAAQPPITPAEIADWMHNTPADGELVGWFAGDDEPVGFALLDVRTGRGNDDRGWVPVLWVRPSHRRRGTGRRLLDVVVEAAHERGRTILDSAHQLPHPAAEPFVTAVGARHELAEDQNRVEVAALDRALLEAWAATGPAGYSIVAWDIPCPEELLEPFARLQDVMNSAPMPETKQPAITTPAMVRDAERRIVASGGERWVVAARHDASGELAGYTEIVFKPYRPWMAEQGDTGVAVAHRGHGIGRWLKGRNALRLLDDKPEVRVVETWNASSNEHMLAINRAMGFRRVSQWRSVELCI